MKRILKDRKKELLKRRSKIIEDMQNRPTITSNIIITEGKILQKIEVQLSEIDLMSHKTKSYE